MRTRAVAVLAALAMVATACGSGSGASPAATTEAAPGGESQRIVSLWANISEVLVELGLGGEIVGRDVSSDFEQLAEVPTVTRSHDVSAESVLALEPTIVLAQDDTGPPEALDQIRAAGIPVVVIDSPTSVGDIGPRIVEIAEAVGAGEAGRELARSVEQDMAQLAAGDGGPSVAFLYMRGSAGVYLMGGPGSGADSMIAAAGARDAGTEMGLENPFTPLTPEALVTAAPEVILVTTSGLESVGGPDGLAEVPGVAQTPAGRNGAVVAMEDTLLYSFGPRTPAALASLAEDFERLGRAPG